MLSVSQITGSQAAAHRFAASQWRLPDEGAGRQRVARVPERLEQAIARTMNAGAPPAAPTPALVEGQADAVAEAASSPEVSGDGFARLLYESLRDAGPQADRAGGKGRGNAYGLERGAGWRGQGWGSLTMRLEALAQRYAATATATAATTTAATTTATATDVAPAATPAGAPAAVDGSDPETAAADVASPSPAATNAAPVAAPPPVDPLLEAYSAMVSIGVGSAAGDAAGLRDFLLEMAAGMRPGGSGSRSLLDLTA